MLQHFLPESFYCVDSEMTHKKLNIFYEKNYTITGKVLRLNTRKNQFEVSLGGNVMAFMPLEESTIYSIYNEFGEYSPSIYTMVGKTIRAKIKTFDGGYYIVLSRKDNMLETLEALKNETGVITATITGFSRLSAFMDIGSGIVGRSYGKHFANAAFKNIKDVGIVKGEFISVKTIAFLEDTNQFELSRVSALPDVQDILYQDDLVTCKVFDPLGDNEGYYVLIDSNYCGIVDSPNTVLNYGDKIVAVIKKFAEKGLRLDLVEKL